MTGETGPDGDDADAPDDVPASDEPTDPTGESRSGDDADAGVAPDERVDPERVAALTDEVAALQAEIDALEDRVDEKTVHRDDITAELKRYVRARQRRGHATGWGPYLVILYGTAMTLGAFYYLGGLWAILAMFVVWLSTLGLFVVSLFVGAFVGVGRKLGSLRDVVGKVR